MAKKKFMEEKTPRYHATGIRGIAHFCRYWLPVIVWMGVIFSFSTRQRVSVSPDYLINFLFFKTLHVLEYGFLFLLVVRAITNSWRLTLIQIFWIAFGITMTYAVTDEWHQRFVPTRQGSPRDVIIDGIGVLLVWYFLTNWLPKAPKKLLLLAKRLELFF